MRKIACVGAILFALSACGDKEDDTQPVADKNGHRLYIEPVDYDGREFLCIVYDDDYYEQGGIWCQEGSGEDDHEDGSR